MNLRPSVLFLEGTCRGECGRKSFSPVSALINAAEAAEKDRAKFEDRDRGRGHLLPCADDSVE